MMKLTSRICFAFQGLRRILDFEKLKVVNACFSSSLHSLQRRWNTEFRQRRTASNFGRGQVHLLQLCCFPLLLV